MTGTATASTAWALQVAATAVLVVAAARGIERRDLRQ